VATLETESSGVEQDLGTIGERERAVTQVLALLLILRDSIVVLTLSSRLEEPFPDDLLGIGLGSDQGDVGDESVPFGFLEVLCKDKGSSELGDVDGGRGRGVDSGTSLLVDSGKGGGKSSGVNDTGRRNVGSVAGRRDLADLTEGSNSFANNATGFGVTNGALDLDEAGKELGDEGTDGLFRVDELGHVISNTGKENEKGFKKVLKYELTRRPYA